MKNNSSAGPGTGTGFSRRWTPPLLVANWLDRPVQQYVPAATRELGKPTHDKTLFLFSLSNYYYNALAQDELVYYDERVDDNQGYCVPGVVLVSSCRIPPPSLVGFRE